MRNTNSRPFSKIVDLWTLESSKLDVKFEICAKNLTWNQILRSGSENPDPKMVKFIFKYIFFKDHGVIVKHYRKCDKNVQNYIFRPRRACKAVFFDPVEDANLHLGAKNPHTLLDDE